MAKKPVVYIDMDDTIVDFMSGINAVKHLYPEKEPNSFKDRWDKVEHIFALMTPLPGAIDAVHKLSKKFEVHILTSAPWENPTAWSDKVKWIHKHFGEKEGDLLYKQLTVSHRKDLLRGAYLIDDRWQNGAMEFGLMPGQTWIRIHDKPDVNQDAKSVDCKDWDAVLKYLGVE